MNRTDIDTKEHFSIVWRFPDGRLLWPPIAGVHGDAKLVAGVLADKRKDREPPVEGAELRAVRTKDVTDDDWRNKPAASGRCEFLDYVQSILAHCQRIAIGRSLYEEVSHE